MSVIVYAPGLTVEVIEVGPPADTNPPETVIVAGPSDSTDTSAVITFTGTDAEGPVTFEGRLDDEMFHPVVPPMMLSNLSVGPHTYEVRAVDAAGNADATPASVTWNVLPPAVAGLTWAKLGEGGASGAYFRRPVVLGNGDIWAAWGTVNSPQKGSYIYSRATNTWSLTSTQAGPGFDVGARENYGAWFDGDRNCVWIGAGAPVAYGQTGDLKFDLVSKTYSQEYPIGFIFGDAALCYHAGALYSIGGWSSNPSRRRDLATGGFASYGGTVQPQFTRQSQYGSAQEEGPRLTYARAGIRADGTLWALANDNELWLCPLNGSWAKVITTGAKPPVLTVTATVVESRNTLVAWAGLEGMVVAAAGVMIRQTWLLDLATLVWSEGPSAANGDAVPTGNVMACTNLLSDGDGALCVVDTNLGTEVWRLAWGSL